MSYEDRESADIILTVVATLYRNDFTRVQIKVQPGVDPLTAVTALAKLSSSLLLEAKAGLKRHGGTSEEIAARLREAIEPAARINAEDRGRAAPGERVEG